MELNYYYDTVFSTPSADAKPFLPPGSHSLAACKTSCVRIEKAFEVPCPQDKICRYLFSWQLVLHDQGNSFIKHSRLGSYIRR